MMVVALGLLASQAPAAENVHLFLKANGTDIVGDSTITSQGREDSIECTYFEYNNALDPQAMASGRPAGRRQPTLTVRKRIDQSTPLLTRAMMLNEVIEGTFKFYRPNPAGDGTTEQFFTVEIAEGRLSSIRRISPDTIDPASATEPVQEEVGFVFHNITWTYEPTGTTFTHSWAPTDSRRSLAPGGGGAGGGGGHRFARRRFGNRSSPRRRASPASQ